MGFKMPERIEIRLVMRIKAEVGWFDSQVSQIQASPSCVTSSPHPPWKNGQKETCVQTRGKTQTTLKARILPSIREDFREAPGWGGWGVVWRGKGEMADLPIAVPISGKWGLAGVTTEKGALLALPKTEASEGPELNPPHLPHCPGVDRAGCCPWLGESKACKSIFLKVLGAKSTLEGQGLQRGGREARGQQETEWELSCLHSYSSIY